jgi:hypothetical protein
MVLSFVLVATYEQIIGFLCVHFWSLTELLYSSLCTYVFLQHINIVTKEQKFVCSLQFRYSLTL